MTKNNLLEASLQLTYAAPYAFVVTDLQGHLLWANPAFRDLCGYELEKMIGKRPGSLLQGPQTDPLAVIKLRYAVRRHLPCQVTLLNYHQSGHPYYCQVNLNPLRDEAGNVCYLSAVAIEVTEQMSHPMVVAQQDSVEAKVCHAVPSDLFYFNALSLSEEDALR